MSSEYLLFVDRVGLPLVLQGGTEVPEAAERARQQVAGGGGLQWARAMTGSRQRRGSLQEA